MAKYQKQPTLESVAARRDQTLAQLIADWAVVSADELAKRCKREGVEYHADFTFAHSVEKAAPKNALVDLAKKNEELPAKKHGRGKLSHDEPATSAKHHGVDTSAPAGSEDPT